MPSTNAVSERSFSAMRRLKTYLRSTMRQIRLNHVLLLNMHKERLDSLDLDIIANDFVREMNTALEFLAISRGTSKVSYRNHVVIII